MARNRRKSKINQNTYSYYDDYMPYTQRKTVQNRQKWQSQQQQYIENINRFGDMLRNQEQKQQKRKRFYKPLTKKQRIINAAVWGIKSSLPMGGMLPHKYVARRLKCLNARNVRRHMYFKAKTMGGALRKRGLDRRHKSCQ